MAKNRLIRLSLEEHYSSRMDGNEGECNSSNSQKKRNGSWEHNVIVMTMLHHMKVMSPDISEFKRAKNHFSARIQFGETQETSIPLLEVLSTVCTECFKHDEKWRLFHFEYDLWKLTTNNKSGLEHHMRIRNSENPFQCSVSIKAQKYTLKLYLRTHFEELSFSSVECCLRFNEKAIYDSH